MILNVNDNYFPSGICYQLDETGKFQNNFDFLKKPYVSGGQYVNAFSQLGISLEYTEDDVSKVFVVVSMSYYFLASYSSVQNSSTNLTEITVKRFRVLNS